MKTFSISLGKFFGIPTTIHWTFWILIVWVIYINLSSGQSKIATIWYLIFVAAIFTCVVLHEIGHALAARRYGIRTKSITILPIGGVAALEKIPEEPSKEMIVAFAGPLVNFLIALFIFLILLASGNLTSSLKNVEAFTQINSGNFLIALLGINILLVLFNLIPAFPMDGGRVFRALLALKMTRVKATQWAVNVGKVFALIFVFWGFSSNPFIIFIALFIFIGANAELQLVKTEHLLKGYKVKDILMKDFTIIGSNEPLFQAVSILLNGQEERFLVIDKEKVVGVLCKMDIIRGLSVSGEKSPVYSSMQSNIVWLDPEYSLQKAYKILNEHDFNFAPVGSPGQLLGVLDAENLQEFLMIKGALARD